MSIEVQVGTGKKVKDVMPIIFALSVVGAQGEKKRHRADKAGPTGKRTKKKRPSRATDELCATPG